MFEVVVVDVVLDEVIGALVELVLYIFGREEDDLVGAVVEEIE